MLCVLNAYEKNGIADINFDNLSDIGIGRDSMRKYICQLEDDKAIKNLSVHGHFPRYKIFTKIECPEFLFDKSLSIGNKVVLMESIGSITSFEKIPMKEAARMIYGSDLKSIVKKLYDITENSGKTIFEHLKDLKYIKKEIFHDKYAFIDNGNGLQIDSYSIGVKTHKCIHCGEIDADKFYTNKKTVCKSCTHIHETEKLYNSAEQFLMQKVKSSATKRVRLHELLLTKEDIKSQLEKQEYKDYYTGLKFKSINDMSVDRLDSDKLYQPDNIVITNKYINMMKNDLSVDEFKKFIIDIYNNIDNF